MCLEFPILHDIFFPGVLIGNSKCATQNTSFKKYKKFKLIKKSPQQDFIRWTLPLPVGRLWLSTLASAALTIYETAILLPGHNRHHNEAKDFRRSLGLQILMPLAFSNISRNCQCLQVFRHLKAPKNHCSQKINRCRSDF